jgi:hypothetical protein
MRALQSFRTMGTTCAITQYHIPKEFNLMFHVGTCPKIEDYEWGFVICKVVFYLVKYDM